MLEGNLHPLVGAGSRGRLGVGASLGRLVRQRVGPFGLDRAASLVEVEATGLELLLSPDAVLMGESAVILQDEELRLVHSGAGGRAVPRRTAPPAATPWTAPSRRCSTGRAGRWHPRLLVRGMRE